MALDDLGRTRAAASSLDGIEGRGIPRVGADLPVEVYSTDFFGPVPARSRDIGIGGLCVATPSILALKSVTRVVVTVATSSGPRRLDLQAQGCWQRDAIGDDVILTGVTFIDPPTEAIDLLWDVVLEAGKHLTRFLYSHSDLRELGVEEAMGLAQVTRYRDVATGRAIYRQDHAAPGEDSIFLISRGAVILQTRVRNASEVTLARLAPGQVFGGLPLLANIPHAESAIADDHVRLLEIDRDAYFYLRNAKPWLAQRLALALTRTYARRLMHLLMRVRDSL